MPLLSRSEVAEDLDVLRRGLEGLHPGLPLRNAPADLEDALAALRGQ